MANETILIVEDEGIIAAQLQGTLASLGYTVHGPVNSGEAALAAVKAQPPDLILMDIKLAGAMDGIAAAVRIQSATDIPIVYLTGYSQDLLFKQAKVTAPYGYLVKPVDERELAMTLEMALYRHSLDRRLRESEEKFRSIFNNIVDLYYQTDMQGLITNLSPSCFVLSGWKPEELIGGQVLDFYTDRKQRKVLLEKLLREGAVSDYEITLLHRDGRHIAVSVSSHLIRNEQGNPKYVEGIIRDISERKRAEDLIKGAELQYRTLAENSPDLIARFDRQLRHSYVNQAAAKAGKYSPEEYIGKTIEEVGVSSQEAKKWEARIRMVFETGQLIDLEDVFETPNGKRYFNTKFVPEQTSDGSIQSVQSIARDITEHKRIAEELMRERDFATGIVDTAQAIILVLDPQGKIVTFNPYMEEISGYSLQEVLGKDWFDTFLPERIRSSVSALFTQATSGIQTRGNVDFMLTRDGRELLIEWYDKTLKDAEGNIIGLLTIGQDITKRKQAESQREAALETLRKTEENFRRSMDESPLGVRIVTAAGETIYANRVLLDFYGYKSVAELNQIPLRERYTPKSYGEYKKRRKIRESGKFGPSEYEISIVRKNGEVRDLQVFRKAILWNGEKQFQVLYRDISESKHWLEKFREFEKTIQGQKMLLDQQSSSVEELIERLTRSREELGASYRELKAKKDDLVHSEKLAFTGRMAAGIAHEIRNPLTNVILSIRQIKKDEKIKPEVLKYAEIMERNTNRIEYLITELLNCARPVKLNLQPWDIHLLIKDILNVHKVRLKTQKIKVTLNLAARPSILPFDKEQLGRVFLNLIANAIEAMRKDGKLSITTKREKKKFIIKIQDNGSGIPEKDLIKVFDPFFSTKKGGTGLGLSTCQNIVASHGGLIEVESAWRKGSVFSVSLPSEPKPPARKENREGES